MAAQGIGEWRPDQLLNDQADNKDEKSHKEVGDDSDKEEESAINKKLGAGPFRAQTREEVQSVIGYLRPSYEFKSVHNHPARYRPKIVEKHTFSFKMDSKRTKPKDR